MKIGILGSGQVGQRLGNGFLNLGHEVKIGSRDPNSETVQAWITKAGSHVSSGTFAEAAAFADVALLATLWSGTENAIKLAGQEHLAGKVVIDATNPLKIIKGTPPALTHGNTDSGGEQVQRWLPQSKIVKAFNIIGNALMVNPKLPGGPPDMFICGNDEEAKKTVTEILTAFGWSTIDIGGIEGSRLLEPMCILWVVYGVRTNSWNHAFKLLRT